MYITSCIYSVGQSTQFSSAVVDALSTALDSVDRVPVREKLLDQAHVLYDKLAKEVSCQFTARTCDELWAHILPHTHGQVANGAALDFEPWPFVDLVAIGGDFAITEQNIRIADTPGINDVDHLICDRTHQYLPRCSATIVTSTTDRVISKSSGQQHLTEALRRTKPGHRVLMVCSQSENVDTNSRLHTAFAPDEASSMKDSDAKKKVLDEERVSFGLDASDRQ